MLSITDNLSKALQRKDWDIVEAMNSIMDVRDCLQYMKDNDEIYYSKSFYDNNEI